jgi:tetratricopeptide (TPR) repeat protein
MDLVFYLEAGPGEWIVQGPASPRRRVESPLADESFRGLAKSLREWSSRPVPLDRPDPLRTEEFVWELARCVSDRLTAALLQELDRCRLAEALAEGGRPQVTIRVRPVSEAWNLEADSALALPWELLAREGPVSYPVHEGRLTVLREAFAESAPGLAEPSGPFTLAVTIASPEGPTPIPHDEESFRLLVALSPLGQRAVFSNLGRLEDLVDLVADVRATAIHFRGYGLPGGLLFEDELGFGQEVPVPELRRRLSSVLLDPQRAGSFPGLFFLATPSTAQSPGDASAAAALHRSGFAQVIGFFGPVEADLNTRLEERFYGALAEGRSALAAAEEARSSLREPVGGAGDRVRYPLGWCQLAVYHRGPNLPLARPGVGRGGTVVQRRTVEVSGLPMLEHGFIGRRSLQHEVRRKVEREGEWLLVIQGLGGLGKTALASQLLVRAFAPQPADQLVLRGLEISGDDPHPLLDLRVQAEEHGRIHGLPFWDERVKDLRERVPDPAAGIAGVIRMLRRQLPGLAVYLDNAETLQDGPATDDPGALGSWRPGLEPWWREMERLAYEDGCLVMVTTRYAWKGLSPRAYIGIPPMERADSLRLIGSFDALRDLPLAIRVRLAEQVDGHPRTVELLDRLVSQRRRKVKRWKDAWNDLIAPVLPEQGEKIRADLLLEKLWEMLSERARDHARALTVLRRPAPQLVIDRMGGARDELIRAGWLTRYREQVIDDEEKTWWIDLWGLHEATRRFLLNTVDADLFRMAHLGAAEAFEEATLQPVSLRTDESEAIHHWLTLGEGDRAWPIVRHHTLWLRDAARFREALGLLEGFEAARVTGDRLALVLLLQAQMRTNLGDRGERLLALLERAGELAETAESRGAVLQERADALMDLGRFEEAERLLRQVEQIDEAAFGSDHPIYCSTLHTLGLALDRQGRHREAEEVFRKAAELLEERLGPDHSFTATLFHSLAGVLERQGRYEEAEAMILRALAQKGESPDHPGHATSLHALAQVLAGQGKYQEAESVLRRSLEIVQEALGETHPSGATALNTLAAVLVRRGKLQEAERLVRRALEITAATLGPDHFEYGVSLQVLGSALSEQGRYAEAEAALREALSIQERTLGADHPDLAPTLQSLGIALLHQDWDEEAEEVFRRTLALLGRSVGERHPSYAAALQALAALLRGRGRLDEASDLLHQAIEIEKEAYDPDHPSVGSTLFTLAQVLDEQGRIEEAEDLLRRSLQIDAERLGTDHPSYVESLHDLALVVDKRGRREEALDLMRSCLATQERNLGGEHPSIASTLTNLASMLMEHAELEEAEELLERAVHLARLPQAEDRRALSEALSALAEAQWFLDHPEAPETALEALRLLESTRGPDHPRTRELAPTLHRIAEARGEEVEEGPSEEEISRLEQDVARLKSEEPVAWPELRVKLDDLADALMQAGRLHEAVRAMGEVVEIGRELGHPELSWDQRFLQELIRLAGTAEEEPDP